MKKVTFTVPNISCGHCLSAIRNELNELEGVQMVEGDPQAKTVTVTWTAPATIEKIKSTLKDINYPAE
jgi:copper chaperone CopZ